MHTLLDIWLLIHAGIVHVRKIDSNVKQTSDSYTYITKGESADRSQVLCPITGIP